MATVAAKASRIQVNPISGALGAEIHGVDLSQPLDEATFADIRKAFLDNGVIFFRDQKLTPDQHKDFARRFGRLNVHPFVGHVAGHPEIIPIIKEKDEKVNFGGGWHSDMSFLPEPSLGSVLYALETPTFGGDTLWANQYLAYEQLSSGMRQMLEGLTAVHTAGMQYGTNSEASRNSAGRKSMETKVTSEAETIVEHPVVRTHPETGRKALFVNEAFTLKFKGWTKRESQPLLRFLFDHATQEPYSCRFRWEPGSIAFWDNRCTQHYALNDYHGQRREMHRVTIDGDKPF